MKKYFPIDCNFYDELILLAQHKAPITLLPNPGIITKKLWIVDIITTATKEEFIVLSSGDQIRLDRIEGLEGSIVFLTAADEEE